MYGLWPKTIPGNPGNTTPTTFCPGDTSWNPIQIEGTVVERCGSLASNPLPPVRGELTAQSLLPKSLRLRRSCGILMAQYPVPTVKLRGEWVGLVDLR